MIRCSFMEMEAVELLELLIVRVWLLRYMGRYFDVDVDVVGMG